MAYQHQLCNTQSNCAFPYPESSCMLYCFAYHACHHHLLTKTLVRHIEKRREVEICKQPWPSCCLARVDQGVHCGWVEWHRGGRRVIAARYKDA